MKYRLKDRKLQKKLDALSAINCFSYCLQEEAWKKERFDRFNYIRVDFGQLSMLDDGVEPTLLPLYYFIGHKENNPIDKTKSN